MMDCFHSDSSWKKVAALFTLGTLAVIPTLFGSFVFDDSEAVLKNAGVVNPAAFSVYPTLFHTDFWGVDIAHPHSHKSYRPLTTLTYRWEYTTWGPNPFPFHLTNIVVHGLNCGLVYFFLQKCLKLTDVRRKRRRETDIEELAWWGSVLFAVHPVHVEPLGAIVGRADIFAAFLFLAAFIVVPLDGQGFYAPLLLTLAAIGASLFKENAIVLPILYVTLDAISIRRLQELIDKKRVIKYSLVVGAIVAFVGWRLWFQGGPPKFQEFDNPPVFAKTLISKVLSVSYVWTLNAFTLACPVFLCYDWSMGCVTLIQSFEDVRVLPVAFAFLVGVTLLTCALRRRVILVALIITGITFLPSSNLIFIVGFVLAERNLYIPSLGYCLLVAYLFLRVKQRKLLIYIVVIFFCRSVQRSTHWIDQRTLFRTGLQVCPNNAKVHYNLGTMYADDGEVQNAEEAYKTALVLRPDYHQAMNNLGNLIRDRDPLESEYWLRKAVRLKIDFAAAWMNLGIVLSKTNQSEALECYKTALKHRRVYPDCEYNLGNLFLDMGDKENALKCWKKATDLKRNHTQAWINIVILLEQQEKFQEAKTVAVQALSILRDCDTLHFIVGNILGKLSEYEAARMHFEEAIQIRLNLGQPVPPKYFTNLGVLFHRWGNKTLAARAYKQALLINPEMESTKKNLKLLES